MWSVFGGSSSSGGSSRICCLRGLLRVFLTSFSGKPLASNTLARCSISGCLLVLSQIRRALSRMPRITPVSILGWWWEWYGMYRSVWVGFLYTAVDSWSPLRVTKTSRNASLPSSSFSIVNSMFTDIWLRCAWKDCRFCSPWGQMTKVSSTYLNQRLGWSVL